MELEKTPSEKQFELIKQKKLAKFDEYPSDSARYLVKKNLKALVEFATSDMLAFKNSTESKFKAINQLINTVVLAENEIEQHFTIIVVALNKAFAQFDDKKFIEKLLDLAEILGVYVPYNVYLPIIKTKIAEEETKQAYRSLIYYQKTQSKLQANEEFKDLSNEALALNVEILTSLESLMIENNDIAFTLVDCLKALITASKHLIQPFISKIFGTLVTIQSILSQHNKLELFGNFILDLALNCGYVDIGGLYSNEVQHIFNDLYISKSYVDWGKYSKDRFKFDVLVRNCKEGIPKYIEIIIEIISTSIQPEKDPELKFDMLNLLDFIIDFDQISYCITENGQVIMQKIITPVTVWRVGKPNIKIRKAGVLVMMKLLNKNILEQKDIVKGYPGLVPSLKGCLTDDWAPDLRFATTCMVEKILLALAGTQDNHQVLDLYPTLLERLDDAQDVIRIESCKTIRVFLETCHQNISSSTWQYIVKACIVHLDDANEEVQIAVFNMLKTAADINSNEILVESESALKKQKYPRLCQELVRYIREKSET